MLTRRHSLFVGKKIFAAAPIVIGSSLSMRVFVMLPTVPRDSVGSGVITSPDLL